MFQICTFTCRAAARYQFLKTIWSAVFELLSKVNQSVFGFRSEKESSSEQIINVLDWANTKQFVMAAAILTKSFMFERKDNHSSFEGF